MSNRWSVANLAAFVIVANTIAAAMYVSLGAPLPSYDTPVMYRPKQAAVPARTEPIVIQPKRIVVDSVGIDLAVYEGSFKPESQSWTVEDGKAFYADASVPPNNSNGTTLLYAHARASAFETLKELPERSTAEIYGDGMKFTYSLESRRDVLPDDVSVFTEAGSPTLVLQTCTGPFDSHRALYSFRLTSIGTA